MSIPYIKSKFLTMIDIPIYQVYFRISHLLRFNKLYKYAHRDCSIGYDKEFY